MKILNGERSKIAGTGALASTQALIYQALHDIWNFNKKRLDALTKRANAYQNEGYTHYEDLTRMRNRLDTFGVDFQLRRDFINNLKKALRFSGKEERVSAEATYIIIFNALHDLYGFGKKRLQELQRKIKFYTWCLLDESLGVHIVDYMQCLTVECGQRYSSLNRYTEKYGAPDIY